MFFARPVKGWDMGGALVVQIWKEETTVVMILNHRAAIFHFQGSDEKIDSLKSFLQFCFPSERLRVVSWFFGPDFGNTVVVVAENIKCRKKICIFWSGAFICVFVIVSGSIVL